MSTATSMSLYSGNTSISGGNVQFGDTNNYHHHHHHHYNYHVLPRVDDDGTILAWLSSLKFGEVLRRHCNIRTPGTGTWLLEHGKYKSWHAHEAGDDRVLWCRGNPGTGKTILCSMVIEHLQSTMSSDETGLFCFFDYARRQELSVDMIFAEFMAQLASKCMPQVSSIIRNLYNNAELGRRRPTLRELTSSFHQAIASFRRVWVVVDALDECDSAIRRQLLNALDLVHNHNIHVLIFSRPHIQLDTHMSKMHVCMSEIQIQASTSDLHLYANSRIAEFEDLECVMDTSNVTVQQIADNIVTKASFSFLAAEMRLNAIGFVLTTEDLTTTLESGLSDPTALYNETLSRIKGQHTQKANLALRVLGWLSVMKRPLTIRELCHVLAIQPGKQVFSPGLMPAADVVINSCFGLVIRDPYNEHVRLLHYTLLEFIEQHGLASVNHETVIETCLTCLSVTELEELVFKVPPTASRLAAIHMQILRTLPFTSYAANHWFDHICTEFESLEFVITYLANPNKVTAWLRILDFHDPKRLRRLFAWPIFSRDPFADSCLGVRVALVMGWRIVVQQIRTGVNVSGTELGTMLTDALDKGSTDFLDILFTHDFDHASKNANGEGLVHQAVVRKFPAAIPILAKFGADIDQRNLEGRTPLHASLLMGLEGCSAALLRNGANVDAEDESGRTALTLALCSEAPWDLIDTILRCKPFISSKNTIGETQLHQVLRYSDHGLRQESLVRTLLKEGANVNASTIDGHTVLHYACIWSSPPVIMDMILRQYFDILEGTREDDLRDGCPELPELPFSCTERDELLTVITSYAVNYDPHTTRDCVQTVINIASQSILRRCANVDYCDLRGESTLHRAVKSQREDILALLLNSGANANYQNRDEKTPLQLAFEVIHLNQRYAELLFDHTKNLSVRDKAGCSMLEHAVKCSCSGNFVERLLPSFDPCDAFMSDRTSFLVGAVAVGHPVTTIEKLILHFPGQINSQDKQGNTAIALAASQGRRDIVILLLYHGADISIRNRSGFAPIHSLLIQYYPCMISITEKGGLRIQPQVPPFVEDDRTTIITTSEPTDLIHKLLQRAPMQHIKDLNAVDSMGRTTLHLIIASRYPLPVVKKVAASVEDVKQHDSLGNSALHIAISSIFECYELHQQTNCLEVFEFLLELDINVHLQNHHKETPLHLLVKHACDRNWLSEKAEGSIIHGLYDILHRRHVNPFIRDFLGNSALSLVLKAWSSCEPPPTEDSLLAHFEKKIRTHAIARWRNSVNDLKSLTNHEIEVWCSIVGGTKYAYRMLTEFLQEVRRKREQVPKSDETVLMISEERSRNPSSPLFSLEVDFTEPTVPLLELSRPQLRVSCDDSSAIVGSNT